MLMGIIKKLSTKLIVPSFSHKIFQKKKKKKTHKSMLLENFLTFSFYFFISHKKLNQIHCKSHRLIVENKYMF